MQKQTDGCNLAYDQNAEKKQSQKKKKINSFFSPIIPSQFLFYTFNILSIFKCNYSLLILNWLVFCIF